MNSYENEIFVFVISNPNEYHQNQAQTIFGRRTPLATRGRGNPDNYKTIVVNI